jgi:cytochrome P450
MTIESGGETFVAPADFHHVTDPGLLRDGHAEWDRLREGTRAFGVCPAPSAFGEPSHADQTSWYILRHQDVYDAYRDYRLFKSSGAQGQHFNRLPIDLDPPVHAKYRRLLNAPLAPDKVLDWEPRLRELARTLVEGFHADGGCEFVQQFAYRYAPMISLMTMGLPLEKADDFLDWSERSRLGRKSHSLAEVQAAQTTVQAYLNEHLDAREAEAPGERPDGDLISHLLSGEVDEAPLSRDELVRYCWNLFSAGLDTVASSTAYMFAHLASHPDERRAMCEDPNIVPNAVEELLRVYSIAVNERLVTEDTEFAGCPMKKGDRIVLPTPVANRDPRAFETGAEIDLSVQSSKHVAFGAGPHRCVGSHLARLELRVALEEWHRVIPDYRIADGTVLRHFAGTAVRLEQLPLVW